MSAAIFPVYECRPLSDEFTGPVRRYANGKWLPDDGEFDLAFIGLDRGAPICVMVDLPHQKNIRWSWLTTHWTGGVKCHPRQNPWHYMLLDGETEWGGSWGVYEHENYKVGRLGMDKLCSEHRCANGVGIKFNLDSKHINAGLLRTRDAKEPVRFPDIPICMYCGPQTLESK